MEYAKTIESKFKEIEIIFDSLPIAIFAINQLFRILRLNETALKFLKENDYRSILNELCYAKIHKRNEICPFCPLMNEWNGISFDQKQYHRIEKIISKKEEKETIYKITFILVSYGRLRMIEIIEDITKEVEKQEEMIRIENLASLGTMISGIAHELNNPLTGISLNLQNLISNIPHYFENQTEKQQEVLYRLKLIQKDLLKASSIVSDILSLSRPGLKEKHPVDLIKVIHRAKDNTIRIYPVLANKIRWEIQEMESLFVLGNADKLERMFFNLFRNSLQAYDYREGVIKIQFKLYPDKVLVMVYDEAGGIPKEILKKVFIPFATTKTTSKGTGLGLSICFSIVKEHNGKIKIRSHDGKTTFYISLPLLNK
ncbi:MAG: PAS domain-containing sensor histidine kinase [Leptospiraceae bacterium]|nr:PAS domain-containing sensor histidine kinase [Leptospiraceae bacterium]MDW7976937.1 PAS domain-containing sensor histidine kinase [Leptospiraceae bacterium]